MGVARADRRTAGPLLWAPFGERWPVAELIGAILAAVPRRHLILPDRGTLLVSTDLHGNLEDFERLRALFEEAHRADPDGAHWVFLGDAVHGPSDEARESKPDLYGYADQSLLMVQGILAVQQAYPGRVHFVLGNHDHGHVGGPHTSKFHEDEVTWLEASASAEELAAMRRLFEEALLAVAAPCGLLMTHGAPNESLERLEDLDALSLTGEGNDERQEGILRSLLTHYGQPDPIAARVLANVSRGGLDLRVIVHGHDRDERGWFAEGQRQLCLCIFGATRANKRYLRVDLGGSYRDVSSLRDGFEIRRLYDDGSGT